VENSTKKEKKGKPTLHLPYNYDSQHGIGGNLKGGNSWERGRGKNSGGSSPDKNGRKRSTGMDNSPLWKGNPARDYRREKLGPECLAAIRNRPEGKTLTLGEKKTVLGGTPNKKKEKSLKKTCETRKANSEQGATIKTEK